MIGQSTIRRDGPLKVTGRARYAYEHHPDRVAIGFVVCSTIAKGRIAHLDITAASRAPGVLDVLTFQNAPRLAARQPQSPGRPFVRPMPVLQDDRVSFYGEPVALVVAETLDDARAAANMIRIDYVREPGLFTLEAGKADTFAPKTAYLGFPTEMRFGDIDRAMAQAPAQLSHRYTTPHQFAQPMEPQACTALWEGDDLKVWASVQIIAAAKSCLAATLGIPEPRVTVYSAFIGGAFGAKLRIHEETVLAALASRRLGRPVKVAQTRRQSFSLAGHRGAMTHDVRLSAELDGRLTAIGHDVNMQGHKREEYVEQVATVTRSLYAAPNRLTRHKVTNLDVVMTEAVRGPGEVPGLLVVESAMDELAHTLGMDPIELRIRNEPLVDPERGLPFGQRRLVDCMRQGSEKFGWSRRDPRPGSRREGDELIGIGMAAAIRTHFQGETRVAVLIDPRGFAVVRTDMTDIGTGTYTILAQMAESELATSPERIRVEMARSDLPTSSGSGGSFGASNSCTALHRACRALRERVHGAADRGIGEDLIDATLARFPDGLQVEGLIQGMGIDPRFKEYSIHTYGATFAEVGVNAVTGEVRVRRMLGVFDTGRIINPMTARSQLIGGMLWGLASALHDDAHIDPVHGNVVNCDLAEYLVPVHADIPEIEALMLDVPHDTANELGIKGVGELGACGTGAAVANAVFNATGVRVRDFPITLDKLLSGLA